MANEEKPMDWDLVNSEISESSLKTKVYIGCDSQKFANDDVRFSAYCINVILHVDGSHGGRYWESIEIEKDYGVMDTRLFNECVKCVNAYDQIKESLGDRYVELHLDLNSDKSHPSNRVVQQAVGYAVGVSLLPEDQIKIKPKAWASSHVADRGCKSTAKSARKRRMKKKKIGVKDDYL